jgi:LAS superfamily LD-carboxypeptidase LdcB
MKCYILFLSLALLGTCAPPPEEATRADTTSTAAPPPPLVSPAEDSIPRIPSRVYLTGRFDPGEHPDFVAVADRYTDGDPYLLHKDTYAAFERMHAAALADGVELRIVSATRNFARQKQIWEAKWNGQRLLEGSEKADEVYPDPADRARAILRYSSMPGTSRHHWGTDIDLNALTNGYFDRGEGKKIYDWLTTHAADYGFCQPYTPKGSDRPHGYEEERWHWSYLPLATQLTDYAASELRDDDIGGFAGAEAAPRIGVIENYVLGINPVCRKP